MIEEFFTKTGVVTRKVHGSATAGDSTITAYSSIDCIERPVKKVADLFEASNMGKEYNIFTKTDYTILVKDIITINSNEYSVIGVTQFDDLEDTTDTYLSVRAIKK